MPTHRFRFTFIAALIATLGVGTAVGFALAGSQRAAEPVVRDALGASDSVRGAKDRTLGLSKVKIQPGGEIPLHFHEGTQVAYIDRGKLTYSVVEGKVKVREGSADDFEIVKKIKAGQAKTIKAGQWIVEQPSDKHEAFNRGKKKIVIYLSTLLETGAPPSTPVE